MGINWNDFLLLTPSNTVRHREILARIEVLSWEEGREVLAGSLPAARQRGIE